MGAGILTTAREAGCKPPLIEWIAAMLRRIAIIIFVTVCAVGVAWWLRLRSTQSNPPVAAPSSVVLPEKSPDIVTSPAVAAPVVAPVKPVEPPADTPATPLSTSDPQENLSTAIPDLLNLIQSGDLLAAYERYMPPSYFAQMPPNIKEQLPQQMRNMQADPNMRKRSELFVQALQLMQSQTPVYNAAGDRATYPISDPSGRNTNLAPFVFQKIDGKWYVMPERGLDL